MPNPRLMIPGPVEAEENVLSAMGHQTLPHYGPLFMTLFNDTTAMLQRLFQTKGDAIMMPGPGTAAIDSAIGSLVPAGDGVCIVDNGFFGWRFKQIIEYNDVHPWVLQADWGQPVLPDDLRAFLKLTIPQAETAGRPIRAVAMVHHETSTGVLNPLPEIAAVVREFDLPLIVDAVASLGGVSIPVDELGIDICVGVPNKCLAVPPGLALVSVSDRAWKLASENPTRRGWYLNLDLWRWYIDNWGDWHPFPTTMPTNNIAALQVGLQNIFNSEGGLYAHYASFESAAARVREGMGELGFTLYPDARYASPIISALNARPDFDIGHMIAFLREERGVMVSGGLSDLKGKIFRIGHMGSGRDPEAIEELLAASREFVETRMTV